VSTHATTQTWLCEPCGYIYDPVEGDPDGGVQPRTGFQDVQSSWFCPVCGATKDSFVRIEE
jgi:rubredoxin